MSRFVPPRYPPVGNSPVADRIRARRGASGLTPLDGSLLHVPNFADGYNSLLGAVRTQGKLPADLRELIILRIAARNKAYFEWMQHEYIGRDAGLTTTQLREIRDVSCFPSPSSFILNEIQNSVLAFTDYSTKDVKVPMHIVASLRSQLQDVVNKVQFNDELTITDKVDDLFVECATVAATYNMVSRILLSTDVGGLADDVVPWPSDKQEFTMETSSSPPHFAYVVTHIINPSAPWIVLVNSLLTDTSMWNHLLPFLLSRPYSYNVLLHSSRGHGKSSTPSAPTTVPLLAKDIANIMDHVGISKAHAIIGVSQGGAAALSFGVQFPDRTKCIIACDTSPRTNPGNKEAWDERIALARSQGLEALAAVTVPRWFPAGSPCCPGDASSGTPGGSLYNRSKWVEEMISSVLTVDGFACGAVSLQDYDLLDASKAQNEGKSLLDVRVKTLLVAGSLDGGGKIPMGMKDLQKTWNEHIGETEAQVRFVEIEGAGHLPMVDRPEEFWSVVGQFLNSVG